MIPQTASLIGLEIDVEGVYNKAEAIALARDKASAKISPPDECTWQAGMVEGNRTGWTVHLFPAREPIRDAQERLAPDTCPHCGNTDGLPVEDRHGIYVLCPHCRARGPTATTRATAVASWNFYTHGPQWQAVLALLVNLAIEELTHQYRQTTAWTKRGLRMQEVVNNYREILEPVHLWDTISTMMQNSFPEFKEYLNDHK